MSHMTVDEAIRRIREAVAPDRVVCIHVEVWSFSQDRSPEATITVYDGYEHYKGRTLAEAVDRCVAAKTPLEIPALEQVDALIASAEAQILEVPCSQ